MDLKKKDLDSFHTEGNRAIQDLCKMAELMGYRQSGRFACNQLQLDNGAFVSSLVNFFEDSPGAVEAIFDWVRENFQLFDEDEDEEEIVEE